MNGVLVPVLAGDGYELIQGDEDHQALGNRSAKLWIWKSAWI